MLDGFGRFIIAAVVVQLWQLRPSRAAQLICRIRSEVEFGIYNQSRNDEESERLIILVTREREGTPAEGTITRGIRFGSLFT